MRVLQICYKLPFPGYDGGEYSIQQSALGLMKQNEIDLTVLAIHQLGKSNDDTIIPEEFQLKTNFKSIPVNTSVRLSGIFRTFFSKISYLSSRYHSKEFEKAIILTLQGKKFDVIQLEHAYLGIYSELIRKYSDAKLILRSQNIEFQLWESISHHTINPFKKFYLNSQIKKLKKFEIRTIKEMDAVITLTEKDENVIKKMDIKIPTKTIPVGFNFETRVQAEPSKNLKPKFYFIGSFDWLPNFQGLAWFIEEIMPELLKRIPEIEIHIAGKHISEFFLKKGSKNLIFHPSIKDSKAFISEMDILIVPLRSGGGMKIKIMEALCLGKNVICTKGSHHGFEQFLPFIDLAEDENEFIKQIIHNFNNFKSTSKMSQILLDRSFQHFDNSNTGKQMLDFYKLLI